MVFYIHFRGFVMPEVQSKEPCGKFALFSYSYSKVHKNL